MNSKSWRVVNIRNEEYFDGFVADVFGSDGDCVTACLDLADARLIASAPELYDALSAMVTQVLREDEEGLAIHSNEITTALAAMAKARGE